MVNKMMLTCFVVAMFFSGCFALTPVEYGTKESVKESLKANEELKENSDNYKESLDPEAYQKHLEEEAEKERKRLEERRERLEEERRIERERRIEEWQKKQKLLEEERKREEKFLAEKKRREEYWKEKRSYYPVVIEYQWCMAENLSEKSLFVTCKVSVKNVSKDIVLNIKGSLILWDKRTEKELLDETVDFKTEIHPGETVNMLGEGPRYKNRKIYTLLNLHGDFIEVRWYPSTIEVQEVSKKSKK
ncbi:MAG: hypothetical protein GX126_05940 [Bacteroidales bacterium]|jgi:flagellar biosynthesis GTPase FlhF|nr:hypothetical protein [Bacteroidales bacterium]